MNLPRPLAAGAVALALASSLTACGSGGASDPTVLRVLAASSLTDVFTGFEKTFEAQHPGVDVQLSFGSSTDLAAQAADGAPGDVLATADHDSMVSAGDAAPDHDDEFATNVLVIATPAGNPQHIRSLADLSGRTWVRCDPEAPCGKVADEVLAAQHVTAKPASNEPDARSTLDKVVSGEADAGLVYATDADSAGKDVTAVPIPGAERAMAQYYVSTLKQSADPTLAADWVSLVTGADGRAALAKAGFGKP
jgi:molybdate transport system substrate-binding protein